jgi:hypothetical protein
MDFDSVSEADKKILGQALRAAADGPFFPDWEFHTLFGLRRAEVRAIADAWPNFGYLPHEHVMIAVTNSLNNLLGYPHGADTIWSQWISVDPEQPRELFGRLRRRRDDERYFHLML